MADAGAGDLANGWVVKESRSGKVYYYNTYTGGTQWEKPALGPGQVKYVRVFTLSTSV